MERIVGGRQKGEWDADTGSVALDEPVRPWRCSDAVVEGTSVGSTGFGRFE